MQGQFDEVTIRTAEPSDAKAIAHVHIASWRGAYRGVVPDTYLAGLDPKAREADWTTSIESGDGTTWVAIVRQRIIGFASVGPSRDEDADDGGLELNAIYLDPESWGLGVARDLMRKITGEVGPDIPMSLWTIAENERAERFYRRHGFFPDGIERIEEFDGEPVTLARYVRSK